MLFHRLMIALQFEQSILHALLGRAQFFVLLEHNRPLAHDILILDLHLLIVLLSHAHLLDKIRMDLMQTLFVILELVDVVLEQFLLGLIVLRGRVQLVIRRLDVLAVLLFGRLQFAAPCTVCSTQCARTYQTVNLHLLLLI